MSCAVVIKVGDVEIPATLNDTLAGRLLAERLPYSVSGNRSQYDYCCPEDRPLEHDPAELQDGWTNGDLLYSGGWFAILFAGEEVSKSYTDHMIVGRIDERYLEKVRALGSSISLTMERA